MGYFLSMTWPWLLLALVLAVLITWVLYLRNHKKGKHVHVKGERMVDGAAVGADESAELGDLRTKNESLRAELDAKNEECEKHSGDLVTAQGRVTELEAGADGLSSLRAEHEDLKAEHEDAKARNAELEASAGTADGLRADLAAKNDECGRHTEELSGLKNRNTELEAAAAAAAAAGVGMAELPKLKADHEALKVRNAELEGVAGEHEALKARHAELEASAGEADGLRADLAAKHEELAGVKARHQELEASSSAELSGLKAEHESVKARNAELETSLGELPSLKARNAELEGVASEHEALKARHTELEASAGEAGTLRAQLAAKHDECDQHTRDLAMAQGRIADLSVQTGDVHALKARNVTLEGVASEHEALKARHAELEGVVNEHAARNESLSADLTAQREECVRHSDELAGAKSRVADLESQAPAAEGQPTAAVPPQAAPAPEQAAPAQAAPADVTGASEALGYKLKSDDLTAVEGIGPKIRELLNAENIHTWRDLSQTEVPVLERILERGGPRFQMHSPSTWPRQAAFLADGNWAAFKELASTLKGGRELV